jgi:hypothetical protein
MSCLGVANGAKLFRHCVFPQSFRGNKKPVFACEKLWKLHDNPDGTLEGSLAWELFVPTTQHVHAYGQRLADQRNQRARDDGKYDEKRKAIYLSAYVVTAAAVRQLPGTDNLSEVKSADVVHKVEAGEIAHAAVIISVNPGAHLEETKTAIIDRLWNNSTGPLTNRETRPQLGQQSPGIDLPPGPKGESVETRNTFLIVCCCVRFYALKYLWPVIACFCKRA